MQMIFGSLNAIIFIKLFGRGHVICHGLKYWK